MFTICEMCFSLFIVNIILQYLSTEFLISDSHPALFTLCLFQEADTDENQGTLTFEEFCVFYKMMSLRQDLYLLLLSYSDKKDHLTVEELAQFLKVEQKVSLDSRITCFLKNIYEHTGFCWCWIQVYFIFRIDVNITIPYKKILFMSYL